MSEYPVQVGKVQAPPLRDETLARDRLLEWLSVKVHRRAVLLIAEAGYGKTTLLADFSRRTRVRVLWFRLDRGDRDWVGFLAYLVAAVRVHMPDFGPSTSALLREIATSAPPLDAVLDTFLRDLGGLPNDATTLVFDDFHLVDDSPDVRHILRELLTRAPERMSFVFASRREPQIKLARLRALGEVAELGTDDLRFDSIETERLFRETYEMPLEPGVLAELSRRTEGWAASLQLVRSALNDRNPAQVRGFISSLSGAEGHLYEYLAEEVIGDLRPELQQFLMRTSLLETVDPVLGPVAAEVTDDETRAFIDEGERHGLFGKGGPGTRNVARAHPLVRDFLQARLARLIGHGGVETIHLRIAKAAETIDWQISTRHYLAADRGADARRVLASSIDGILASGAYAVANELANARGSEGLGGAAGLVLRSRLAQQRAALEEGLELAEQAWAVEPSSTPVLANLLTARSLAGDVEGALAASRILEKSGATQMAHIARAYQKAVASSLDGSVEEAARELEALIPELRHGDANHYLGVAQSNLAYLRLALDDPAGSLACADEAIHLLAATSAGHELVSARMGRAWALAFLGQIHLARGEARVAESESIPGQLAEIAFEVGNIESHLGESALGWESIQRVGGRASADSDSGEQLLLARVLLSIRDGDVQAALRDAATFRHGEPRSTAAFEAQRNLVKGLALVMAGQDEGLDVVRNGLNLALAQGARLWARYGSVLLALADQSRNPSAVLIEMARLSPTVLSMLAEAVLLRIAELNPDALNAVVAEAERRPWRWLALARRVLDSGKTSDREAAGRLLERIGEREDVLRLGRAGGRLGDRHGQRLGYLLARRLADRVLVEDLGRVQIVRGKRTIEGADVRRKVLALLCLLLTRPRFAATREEVIDSLWPDNDPTSALNSLNQTVYFLRRVFEPDYADAASPGYVGQDGETIWLDSELIGCRSRRCLELIRSMPGDPTPDGSLALAGEYRGRFALDFAYEDWSVPYRDALHAAYLRVMEHAIQMDMSSGQFARGTFLAERAAEVDPDSEDIQIALVRLYRHSGAHAAAAEQYAHYEKAMRDLGVEPPAFADV